MKYLLLVMVLMSSNVFAHGDHSIPGALPVAPNGGVIGEASHQHAGSGHHDHLQASNREVYFEARVKGNTLFIYPLSLSHGKDKSFIELSSTDFSKTKLVVKNPRKNKTTSVRLKVVGGHWESDISHIKGRRLVLSISSLYKHAKYNVDIQIERR